MPRCCGSHEDCFEDGPDRDDDVDRDEDPSDEDLERFGGDTAWCPACDAEIYEDSVECPKCGEMIEQGLAHRPDQHRPSQQKVTSLTAILLIVAIVIAGVFFGAIRLF
jgi:hypothetical protein